MRGVNVHQGAAPEGEGFVGGTWKDGGEEENPEKPDALHGGGFYTAQDWVSREDTDSDSPLVSE